MYRITNAALALFGFAGAVFFFSATWVILRAPNLLLHADGMLTRSEVLISKTYATMNNLDKASKTWADSSKEQADDVRKLVQRASAATDSATGAIADVRLTLSTVREQTAKIGPLLASTTKVTDAIPVSLDHLNQAVDATKPPLGALTVAINSGNKIISDPNIAAFTYHLAGTANNVEQISGDFHVWSHPLLNPDPCLNAKCRWARGLNKAAGYAGLGADVAQFSSFWRALPVSVKK